VFSIELFLDVGSNVLEGCINEKMSAERRAGKAQSPDQGRNGHLSPKPTKPQKRSTQVERDGRTFSILYSESAFEAISTASCCIWSLMSAFLITAFRCSLMAASCFTGELCNEERLLSGYLYTCTSIHFLSSKILSIQFFTLVLAQRSSVLHGSSLCEYSVSKLIQTTT
jgi:hypothetical protein